MANAMKNINRTNSRLQTKPQGQVLSDIKQNTRKLFEAFGTRFLSLNTGLEESTLRSHKCRLKLSQEAATYICELKEVAAAGFTRKQLRPDIQIWFDEK